MVGTRKSFIRAVALLAAVLASWTGAYFARPAAMPPPPAAVTRNTEATAAQIASIRHELEEANGSRLEIIMGGMGLIFTTFGIASTILLVVIAVRVDRSAVAVAERAVAGHTAKLDERVIQADISIQKIKDYETSLSRIATKTSAAEPLSRTDAAALTAAVRDAGAKSLIERTPADLLALIADASEHERWRDILEFSTILRMRAADDPAMECASYYHEAAAWTYMERLQEALASFSLVLTKFASSTSPEVRVQYAKSSVNYGVILIKMGKYSDAIAHFDGVIARPVDSDDTDQVQRRARAQIMRAYALDELGHVQQAIDELDAIIASLDHHTDPGIIGRVATAYYNKACGLAKLSKPQLATNALALARDKGFTMGRDSLMGDRDLKSIQGSAVFRTFLAAFPDAQRAT